MKGKFKFQDNYVYKMPAHFGGHEFFPVRVAYHDMTGISVQYETDPDVLLQYIPELFELLEPVVNIQFNNCRDVEWMSGGEYRLVQVTAPVKFIGNSECLKGDYALAVWENLTCPIIGGREEDGIPKIFADIATERHSGDYWFTAASYESNTFLKIDFVRKAETPQSDIDKINENPKINLFGWRILPNLGKGGNAISQATLYPQEAITRKMWIGEGTVKWNVPKQEEHPLQAHIIKALANLPILKYTSVSMMKASAQLNVGDSRVLS